MRFFIARHSYDSEHFYTLFGHTKLERLKQLVFKHCRDYNKQMFDCEIQELNTKGVVNEYYCTTSNNWVKR